MTGQPIGLSISAISLLLDLTSNEEEALYKFLKYMNDIVHEKIDNGNDCTAYGFLDHSLKEDCATITISLKGVIRWPNAENSPPSLKPKLFSKSLVVRLPKQKSVGEPHNLNENQLSHWKRQLLENASTLFDSTDKQSSEVSEKRIAHLEQLVGRLTVALDIQKRLLGLVEMTVSEKRSLISALHQEYSVREICETLGFNRSSFYYHPQEDPSEDALRAEIEKLAGKYPRYGYRRITQLLLRRGYTVGTRRVARLMRTHKLLVAVKRVCRTTQSSQDAKPWDNRLGNLQVSRRDQVWVSDITYVRLKGRFIYVCLLMDVFTRMIRAWQLSQHLNQSLTLKPLKAALCHNIPEIHHSDQGVQYLSNAYIATIQRHGIEISVAPCGCSWENGYAERLIRTLKEEVHLNDYQSITEARDRIGDFIRQVYHQKRPHSALGNHLTPVEFQGKNLS